MTTPGRIYWDVDGVFNAIGSQPMPERWGWDNLALAELGWSIRYSPDLVAEVNDITAAEHVECFWLTTWLTDAPLKLAPTIGLKAEDWTVVGWSEFHTESRAWWKLAAIQAHIADFDGPVLWIDDDLNSDSAARAWLLDNQDRYVGLCPSSDLGITKRQAGLIRAFVEGVVA